MHDLFISRVSVEVRSAVANHANPLTISHDPPAQSAPYTGAGPDVSWLGDSQAREILHVPRASQQQARSVVGPLGETADEVFSRDIVIRRE